jgi:NAD(P)-dependent dehydrogenase (short-subunit alcohol dehydrogenase family)
VKSAKQLEKDTGGRCVGVSADVRDQKALDGAVEIGLREFGKIDFVICGEPDNPVKAIFTVTDQDYCVGAAGNLYVLHLPKISTDAQHSRLFPCSSFGPSVYLLNGTTACHQYQPSPLTLSAP